MLTIDTTTEFGARAARRLRDEQIAWLTTTGADGTPQPNPVWFLWTEGEVLIYSQPDQAKLRNIARTPRVALNFNTNNGGDVVVLTGSARIADQPPSQATLDAYFAKYAAGIASLGATPDGFAQAYSVLIVVAPEKLRGF